VVLAATALASVVLCAQAVPLPNRPGSVKFAVIGDNGTGDRPQYEVADQMAKFRAAFPFDLVIMLGDNLYGGQDEDDLVRKFEKPYAALLAAGVKFQASLGNHDRAQNASYPLWNMGGQPYYTFARGNVRFFVLDSTQMGPKQVQWLEQALGDAREDWKIAYFHHPLYSNASRHGSSVDLRVLLEPIFVKRGVDVVFAGHDHVYERIKPQNGITHFVMGASGQLRRGNMRPTEQTAAFFDQDQSFMLVEIAGDALHFQAISRIGKIVDSGLIQRDSDRNEMWRPDEPGVARREVAAPAHAIAGPHGR
jgi:predicted phosphodiesterase